MTNKWLAGYVLISLLTIAALVGYAYELRTARQEAQASVATAALEAEHWKQVAEATPKEITKLVPTLVTKTVTKYIKAGVVEPIVAAKGEATSQVVQIPCPSVSNGQGAEADTFTPTVFKLFGDFIVTDVKGGIPLWTGELRGQAQAPAKGTEVPAWSKNLVFNPEDIHVDVLLSSKIHKAMAAYDQPWIKRHTGLACPGAGLIYNPFTQRVDVGLTCSYSMVWF